MVGVRARGMCYVALYIPVDSRVFVRRPTGINAAHVIYKVLLCVWHFSFIKGLK